jgi:hypothetical protein
LFEHKYIAPRRSDFQEVFMSSSSIPLASTVFDSILFRDAFGTPKMREIFSDRALIQRYIDAEIALAKAEAHVGVIPAEAAEINRARVQDRSHRL